MIYLCAGLYAEGRSDYAFLLPLIDRMLYEASTEVVGMTEVAESVPIDAPPPFPSARADRIANAIHAFQDRCTLFVVHADADRDHEAALRDRVDPGRRAAPADAPIVACIPVREIEAWMLSDRGVFTALLAGADPTLPRDPEVGSDPKQTLKQVYKELRLAGAIGEYYGFFGQNIVIDSLRRLPAFRRFEDELKLGVESLGRRDSSSPRGR